MSANDEFLDCLSKWCQCYSSLGCLRKGHISGLSGYNFNFLKLDESLRRRFDIEDLSNNTCIIGWKSMPQPTAYRDFQSLEWKYKVLAAVTWTNIPMPAIYFSLAGIPQMLSLTWRKKQLSNLFPWGDRDLLIRDQSATSCLNHKKLPTSAAMLVLLFLTAAVGTTQEA